VRCVSSASGFLLASALSLHEPLRTPSAEDARCVQPTSATRTNTITRPPYVLDSLERLSPLGTPRDSPWLSRCVIEATSIFTMLEALRPLHLRTRCPRAFVLAASGHERRPVRLCGARWDETSDASVTNPSSSSRSRHLRACSRVPPAQPYLFGCRVRVGRVRGPPRPPLSPDREDR